MARLGFNKFWSGNQIRLFIDDCVLPFIGSFVVTALLCGLVTYINKPPTEFPDTAALESGKELRFYRSKSGQLYLRRESHRILQNGDVNTSEALLPHSLFSIKAQAEDNFTMIYEPYHANSSKGATEDPPGTVWPWPRIELEAPDTPLVWVVTPTYRNPLQYAELTRLAQALYPARKFVRWLLVDNTNKKQKDEEKLKTHLNNLNEFLGQFPVNFTLMRAILRTSKQRKIFKPKGVEGRRTAIAYIRRNKLRGVVYFADDDNTYDSDIFRQMQATKTVSIWPTGAITQWCISSPVVNKSGTVVDFFDAWVANRKFPVDFASVAINTDLLHNNPRVNIPFIQGYEETIFMNMLGVPRTEFMPLAANATQVLTWHTKTYKYRSNSNPQTLNDYQWPASVRRLVKKYDFLFENTDDRVTKFKDLKLASENVDYAQVNNST